MRLEDGTAHAALSELARLAGSAEPPHKLAERALTIVLRTVEARAGRVTLESSGGRQVLHEHWPDGADLWKSRLSLPLLAGGRAVGRLECAAPAEAWFDASRRAFVETSASLLGPPLGGSSSELAQSVLELRTLQRVAETLSRSIDLEEVLGRCLEMALQVAHAPAGAIYLRDGKRGVYRRMLQRNVPEEVAPREIPLRHVEPRFTGDASQLLEIEQTRNPERDPDLPVERSPLIAVARRQGFKRVVFLPLRAEERLVGLLGLHFFNATSFVRSTLLTLEAIAGQEAIAIENARVHRQAELRAQIAQQLLLFLERSLAPLSLDELYRLILDTACALTRADHGFVARFDADGQTLRVVARKNPGVDLPAVHPADARAVREMQALPRPFVIEDLSTLPADSALTPFARLMGIASFGVFAMQHRDQAIGYISIGSKEVRRYETPEIEGMQILAALGAEVLERARVQSEAEGQRRRLDAIIEDLPIVIAVISRTGQLVNVNRAAREFGERFGSNRDQDWTQSLSAIVPCRTDGRPIPFEELQVARALQGERPGAEEIMLRNAEDTERRYVMSVAAPLFDDAGRVQEVVTAFQDVSALRALAESKDRFLRIASHELRSPITSLRATTSLLELDPSTVTDPARRATMLQRVQRQVDRLIKLVEQLLDSARLDADQVPLQIVECDLAQLASEAIELAVSGSRPEDRARVRLEVPGPVRGVWDPLRVEQVLINLVSNALRYSPFDQPVEVRISDGDLVRIAVTDRGIGIPHQQIDQVFSPFFRGQNAQSQHRGGLGLGLHITAEIVRRHQGKIHVTSELGRGSTFTVELPRRP
jgi:signal transduction histidine kinase